jgi:hypothetical protein
MLKRRAQRPIDPRPHVVVYGRPDDFVLAGLVGEAPQEL